MSEMYKDEYMLYKEFSKIDKIGKNSNKIGEEFEKQQIKNLTTSKGSLLIPNWSSLTWDVQTLCTVSDDLVNFHNGTKGYRCLLSSAGASATMSANNQLAMKWENIDSIDVNINVNNLDADNTKYLLLNLILSLEKSSTLYTGYRIDSGSLFLHAGQNTVRFFAKDGVALGSPVVADLLTSLRIKVNATTGQTPDITIDAPIVNVKTRGKVIICIDDCREDSVNNSLSVLNKYGYKATFFAVKAWVGTTGNQSLQQLLDIQSQGHDIGNHTSTHVDATGLTYNQLVQEYGGMMNWMIKNGLTSAPDHIAFPDGIFTPTALQVMKDCGIKTGQFMFGNRMNYPPFLAPLVMKRDGIDYMVAKATVDGWINDVALKGNTRILLFHYIVPVADSTAEISIDDFTHYMETIKASGVDVVTMSEWYKLASN